MEREILHYYMVYLLVTNLKSERVAFRGEWLPAFGREVTQHVHHHTLHRRHEDERQAGPREYLNSLQEEASDNHSP